MSSQSRSNRVEVPEAKAAMDKFKTEVASELGVNLKEGYNEINHPVKQVPWWRNGQKNGQELRGIH